MSYDFHVNRWGERFIEALQRNAFLEKSSTDYYQRYPLADFRQPDTLFILVGSDSGLLLNHVQTQTLHHGSRVVAVEPDDVHEALIAEGIDAGSIPLYNRSNWKNAVLDENVMPWFLGGRVEIIESQACLSDFSQVYLPLHREIKRAVEHLAFSIQTKSSSQTFMKMQLKNAADNQFPLERSADFGRNRTAIVLGGGPSLDQHIDWIIKHREQLFIISVSRLCKQLDEWQLKPDLLVCIDPAQYSFDMGKQGILWKDVPLVCAFHANPAYLQQWQGPLLYLGHRLPWQRQAEGEDQPISASGPTVGHTATVLASQLGFTQILLTGVDLCYGTDLRTHAKGTPEALLQSLPSMYDAQVLTYDGHTAGTREHLLQGLQVLESIGSRINEHVDVLFNLSGSAARVDSIPYRAMEDVVLPSAKPPVQKLLAGLWASRPSNDLHALGQEIKHAKRGFQRIDQQCSKAATLISDMYGKNTETQARRASRELDKVEKLLERRTGLYMHTIKHFSALELSSLRKPSGFTDMEAREQETWIRSYYHILATTARQFLDMIDDLERRIALRLREQARVPDIDELLSAWKEDGTPGRILRYRLPDSSRQSSSQDHTTLHAALVAAVDEKDRGKVELASLDFIDSLEDTDTVMSRQLMANNNDINHCMRSLLFLFNTGSVDDLQILVDRLDAHTWPASVLAPFCQGMIAELDDQREQAIACYQQVIDKCSQRLEDNSLDFQSMQRILEETLVRMTQACITLGDRQSACGSLGLLCEMMPRYIPSFAKLLNLSGESDRAVELLTSFLENYPDQWRAAIVLADIHASAGNAELANMANALSEQMRERSLMAA